MGLEQPWILVPTADPGLIPFGYQWTGFFFFSLAELALKDRNMCLLERQTLRLLYKPNSGTRYDVRRRKAGVNLGRGFSFPKQLQRDLHKP